MPGKTVWESVGMRFRTQKPSHMMRWRETSDSLGCKFTTAFPPAKHVTTYFFSSGIKKGADFYKREHQHTIKGLSISSLVFLFLDSIRVAVYDPQFKTMLIYLILGLVSVPHFILCLKQVVKSHLSLRLLKGITAGGWGFCAHSRVLLQ